MVVQVVAVFVVVAVAALAVFMRRSAAGPGCPRCGALTRERPDAAGPHAWLERISFAAECPVCGWNGRLRRQPPLAVLARGRGRGGRR